MAKASKSKPRQSRTERVDDLTIKKKPSKAHLKAVIEHLKKEPNVVIVRKALKYIPFYLKSEGLTNKLTKEIVRLWSESSENIRVVSLLCLIRIYTKLKDKERKQDMIKKLYQSFLDKCRVTKHETMSMIGFMRHSLVELYKIDPQIALKQAQTSCQQLGLTLRNATTHKNEETYKTVLNWQFANCLILLTNLIISHDEGSPVKTLTHQVIQLNLGSLNLLHSPRYYPFYCHLIDNLVDLSISTNLFIPILPIILGMLDKIKVTFDRKSKTSTKSNGVKNDDALENNDSDDQDDDESSDSGKKKKTYNMDLLNHVSLEEAHCPEYNNAVLDRIHYLLLKYLASQCHRIAFPELILLPCVQLKKWLKNNQNESTKKFKLLYDKIKSDREKIEDARKSVDFSFSNCSSVDAWEKRMRDSKKLSLPKMFKESAS